MQEQKGNVYSDILKSISAFLTLALPIVQFLQTFSQGRLYFVKFLGDQAVIFTTSLIALLLSVFVLLLFKSNPYFRFTPPFQGKKTEEWQEFLRKTNPNFYTQKQISKVKRVSPPTEVTSNTLTWISILLFLLSSFTFIWLGLSSPKDPDSLRIIFQAFLYVIAIVSAVYILAALTSRLNEQDKWKTTRLDRIKRAINLAKEHDGFENFPKINFKNAREQFFQGIFALVVEVSVEDSVYEIVTDAEANVLHGVNKIPRG